MAILKHEGISLDEERKFCVGVGGGGKCTPVFSPAYGSRQIT